MYVEFHGAAEQVTGSLHRVHVGDVDVVLDCGLYQGRRAESNRLNRELPAFATKADAVVLSHAHMDHSGNLPGLVKAGYAGNIYCTPATRDLCSVMLRDGAMIQQQDARYLNRRAEREGSDVRVEPLYDLKDAMAALGRMIAVPYGRPMPIAPGVTMTLLNSGHVLGSALVQLDLQERGRSIRLVFSGDLGRPELPLLDDPQCVDDADALLLEATYGDRRHPAPAEADDKVRGIIERTIARGGRVYIPAFALERAQEIIYSLSRMLDDGRLQPLPIYIDSPLATAVTEIYKLHPEALDAKIQGELLERRAPLSPPGLRYVSGVEESKALQRSGEPCIVLAGSGMCEAGRIVHHFVHGLQDKRNSVIIVGFMAQHTLGRRLAEGHRRVRVLGIPREVSAEVYAVEGLSAHADERGLLAFARQIARRGNLRKLALVHGEPDALAALQQRLQDELGTKAQIARRGERMEL